jgi:hypothetical protein
VDNFVQNHGTVVPDHALARPGDGLVRKAAVENPMNSKCYHELSGFDASVPKKQQWRCACGVLAQRGLRQSSAVAGAGLSNG